MKKIYHFILIMLVTFNSFSQECDENYSLFYYSASMTNNNLVVTFYINNSSIPFIESYDFYWDFGDGSTSISSYSSEFTHIYNLSDPGLVSLGMFTADVTLELRDEETTCVVAKSQSITYGLPIAVIEEVNLIATPCCEMSLGEKIDLSFLVSTLDQSNNLEYELKVNGSPIESDFISTSDLNTEVDINPYTPAASGIYIFTLDIYQFNQLWKSSLPLTITIKDDDVSSGTSGTCIYNGEYPKIDVTYTVDEDTRRISVKITDVSSSSFKENYADCGKYWLAYKGRNQWLYLAPCLKDNPLTDYSVTGFPDFDYTLPAVFGSYEPDVCEGPEILKFQFWIESTYQYRDYDEYIDLLAEYTLVVPPRQIKVEDNEIDVNPLGDNIIIDPFLPNGACYSTIMNNPLNRVDELDWVQNYEAQSNITFTVPPNLDDQPRQVAIKIYPGTGENSQINSVINGQQMNYRLVTVTHDPYLTYIDPNCDDLISIPDFSYDASTLYFGLSPSTASNSIIYFKNPDQLPYDLIEDAYFQSGDSTFKIYSFDENMDGIESTEFDVFIDGCKNDLSYGFLTGLFFEIRLHINDLVIMGSQTYAHLAYIDVDPGQNLVFYAPDEITITPPFKASQGSYFHAKIGTICRSAGQAREEDEIIPTQIIEEPLEVIESQEVISETNNVDELREKSPIAQEIMTVTLPEEDIFIYPNPTDGLFTVELVNIDDVVSIEVFNPNGTKVMFITPVVEDEFTVDLSSYADGVYLLKFNRSDVIDYKKVIVR